MSTLLIDKQGKVWNSSSQAFHAHCGISQFTKSIERFLVRNAGYITCRYTADAAIVAFAPVQVTQQSCLAISRLLDECRPKRLVLSWFQDGWHEEILADHNAARQRLLQLIVQQRSQTTRPYYSRPTQPDSLTNENSLARLLAFWQLRGQQIDLVADAQVLANCTEGRYLAITRNPDDASVVFAAMGAGWSIYDESWPKRTIGQRVEHQPDLTYGKWVADCYEQALDSNHPKITDNDVFVSAPYSGQPKRFSYQRLTLPITDRNGKPALLSATRVDSRIRLNFEVGHKGRNISD